MGYHTENTAQFDHAAARRNMVNGQLLTNGIHDRALVEAYLQTPREKFLDDSMAGYAYLDEDLQIAGTNRWVLEPLVEARILQLALSSETRNGLVIGAASLPSIEMLAGFVNHLTVVEPDKALAFVAEQRLARPNVSIIQTNYKDGYARTAPYDLVFLSGAVHTLPESMLEQLAIGGVLVGVLRGNKKAPGRIIHARRLSQDTFDTTYDADALTPYLAGFEPAETFRF